MIACGTAGHSRALGAEWDGLFEAQANVQSRRAWFEASEAAALPAEARACYLTGRDRDGRLGLLPLRLGPGQDAGSLTSPYTVLFQPLLAAGCDAGAFGRAWGGYLRRHAVTVLEAMDPAWPALPRLLSGFRQAGLAAARFDHFGNWHERVAGLTWSGYLAARPGALRETLRRRSRLAERDGLVRFTVARGAAEASEALAGYEAVYGRSWKAPEPFPDFNAALVSRMAAAGALRLGLLWHGDVPVAAQYWTVVDGHATVLKLAHDDACKALSPGTLLTAHMIRGLLETEQAHTLDFGRGDDPYKRQWAATRGQRIGVMLANPLHPRGLAALARHAAGQARRRLAHGGVDAGRPGA